MLANAFQDIHFLNLAAFIIKNFFFQVMISDDSHPPLSSTTRVVVKVEDINDHAPEFEQQFYKVQIPAIVDVDTPLFQVKNCCLLDGISVSVPPVNISSVHSISPESLIVSSHFVHNITMGAARISSKGANMFYLASRRFFNLYIFLPFRFKIQGERVCPCSRRPWLSHFLFGFFVSLVGFNV